MDTRARPTVRAARRCRVRPPRTRRARRGAAPGGGRPLCGSGEHAGRGVLLTRCRSRRSRHRACPAPARGAEREGMPPPWWASSAPAFGPFSGPAQPPGRRTSPSPKATLRCPAHPYGEFLPAARSTGGEAQSGHPRRRTPAPGFPLGSGLPPQRTSRPSYPPAPLIAMSSGLRSVGGDHDHALRPVRSFGSGHLGVQHGSVSTRSTSSGRGSVPAFTLWSR